MGRISISHHEHRIDATEARSPAVCGSSCCCDNEDDPRDTRNRCDVWCGRRCGCHVSIDRSISSISRSVGLRVEYYYYGTDRPRRRHKRLLWHDTRNLWTSVPQTKPSSTKPICSTRTG